MKSFVRLMLMFIVLPCFLAGQLAAQAQENQLTYDLYLNSWESAAAGNEYGHVAVVERVNDDGTFDVHERNISPTARNTCGEGRRCGLQPQEGISFIRIICSIEPIPMTAPNAPSYLVVPKEISPENTKNVFVYFDTGRWVWDGVQFPNVSGSDNATLFFVDGTWQAEHPGWTEFRWNYVHVCSGQ